MQRNFSVRLEDGALRMRKSGNCAIETASIREIITHIMEGGKVVHPALLK